MYIYVYVTAQHFCYHCPMQIIQSLAYVAIAHQQILDLVKKIFTYGDGRQRWLPSLGLVARFPRSSVFGRLTPPLHRSTTTATHPHSTSGSWQLCQVVGFNTSLLAALKHLALGNLENLFRCSTSRNSLSMTHPIQSRPIHPTLTARNSWSPFYARCLKRSNHIA